MGAPKGHPRYGGRTKGVPNKSSIARAEAMTEDRKRTGRKGGVEAMSEIMNYFLALGAKYQPRGESPDEAKCAKYLKMAADIASDVAQYETPKLQSTTLRGDTDPNAEPIRVQLEIV